MKIRRLLLDVDTAIQRLTPLQFAVALEHVSGIQGVNITVTEMDVEAVGMDVTVEEANLEFAEISRAIESTGAVTHSIDVVVIGA
ncbi:MAG TPA: DUF211 domain-containing protein [Terriglobales bacterium]|jgi:hypothetical protein|nr:DUF211 domain-containing protein [Terriglobales bacterium]